jgi:hypothetical protein
MNDGKNQNSFITGEKKNETNLSTNLTYPSNEMKLEPNV